MVPRYGSDALTSHSLSAELSGGRQLADDPDDPDMVIMVGTWPCIIAYVVPVVPEAAASFAEFPGGRCVAVTVGAFAPPGRVRGLHPLL